MSKPSSSERPPMLLGRPSNSVAMGIVGMPNVGKCFGRDTAIMMYDGTIRGVQEIHAGDKVMGDDCMPRTVQPGSVIHGTAPLYRIEPQCSHATPFICNGAHILVTKSADKTAAQYELSVDDYMTKCGADQQSAMRMYKPSIITYSNERRDVSALRQAVVKFISVEPTSDQIREIAWFIGVWLASGLPNESFNTITQRRANLSVIERCRRVCSMFDTNSLDVRQIIGTDGAPLDVIAFSNDSVIGRILTHLRVLIHKHIPHTLMTESVDIRGHLLAGLIDGDDQYSDTSLYTLSSPDADIIRSYKHIALTLGHRVSEVARDTETVLPHLIRIDGNRLHNLKRLLSSERATVSVSKPSSHDSDIDMWSFSVECIGVGEYFGFTVDGNHRFLLGDLTVTHNSTLFNALSKLNVPAENYPFCTIDPSTAKVPVPDERFDFLVKAFQPKSVISAVLTITDIAGLVKGANEGKGLGNNFLSHISAVDAIYHVVRAFKDKEIEHVEGSVDPVRDLEIISDELILKDLSIAKNRLETVKKMVEKGADKSKKADAATLTVAVQVLEEKKDIRSHRWALTDVDVLNELQFLTAKPVVYLVNIGEDEYLQQKNKFIPKIKEWVSKRDPDAKVIPFSAAFESKVIAMSEDDRKTFLATHKVPTQIPKIITTGYHTLDLIHYFTCGPDEVRAWTVKRGVLAPGAAGVIHTDFQKAFIAAETYSFDDFKECGSESAVKAAGKYRTKGKDYVVQDGDIMFFKHNASSLSAKKK